MFTREGLFVLSHERRSGKHYRYTVQRNDGEQHVFTVSVSASDHRSILNLRAQARRFANR